MLQKSSRIRSYPWLAAAVAFGFQLPASAQTADSAAAPAPAAAAPAAAAASPFTANVTIASQYVSRGFRQTWGKPATP